MNNKLAMSQTMKFIVAFAAFVGGYVQLASAKAPLNPKTRKTASQGEGRLGVSGQMADLASLMQAWTVSPTKDSNARAQIFALMGDITVRESMIRLTNAQLRDLIADLVIMADGDDFGDAGMIALDLNSVLGGDKILPMIKDLDSRGLLRQSIKRVTAGDH